MMVGKSLAETAQLSGVHPTTAFRWRHRVSARAGCQQAAKLKRDRRSGRDLRPRILQGPMVRSAAPVPRKRGGKARHPGPYQDNIPVLVARDRKGATFDAVLPQVDGASIGRALAGVVTQDNHL